MDAEHIVRGGFRCERMEEGKDECRCGRSAELVVARSSLSLQYESHQHLTNLH